MAKFTLELEAINPAEKEFIDTVFEVVNSSQLEDCRRLAEPIRSIARLVNIDVEVGTGASHVWVHRKTQFVSGEHNNPNNKRWFIITDQ